MWWGEWGLRWVEKRRNRWVWWGGVGSKMGGEEGRIGGVWWGEWGLRWVEKRRNRWVWWGEWALRWVEKREE